MTEIFRSGFECSLIGRTVALVTICVASTEELLGVLDVRQATMDKGWETNVDVRAIEGGRYRGGRDGHDS
jgi:hypothetical protein